MKACWCSLYTNKRFTLYTTVLCTLYFVLVLFAMLIIVYLVPVSPSPCPTCPSCPRPSVPNVPPSADLPRSHALPMHALQVPPYPLIPLSPLRNSVNIPFLPPSNPNKATSIPH